MKIGYVVSRVGVAAILSVALDFAGLPWWGAVAAGVLALVFFLAVPRSGRYVVEREGGVAPFRRDERSRAIRDKAARNAFVLTLLSVAGLAVAYGRILDAPVPVAALGSVLSLSAVTYAVSDLCLRRRA